MGGQLLAELDFDDCPDFARWLEDRRAEFERMRCAALAALADQAESAGQTRAALGLAHRLVASDPLSEEAHRRLMRLFALNGDQASAAAAFERCRKLLWNELSVAPGAETMALFKEIETSAGARRVPGVQRKPMSPGLIRPPRFAGRREELERTESAWGEGKALFISGAAGVGKTRLMQEFIAGKERCHLFEGRPADVGTPYATYSRTLREVMQAYPNLQYPDWVVREAARILPEMGGVIGLSMDDASRLHFHQALAEANDIAVRAGMQRVLVDDMHLVDLHSLLAGHFVYARHWESPDYGMKTLMVLRPQELAREGHDAMNRVLDRDLGVEIRLGDLGVEELAELLAGIDPAWAGWAERLHRHCGGNPGFVLETFKALQKAEALDHHLPDALPLPDTVRALLARSIQNLGGDVIQLARLAALAGTGIDLEKAARVLNCAPVALMDTWLTLETKGVLRNGRPVHNLMQRVLAESVPDALRTSLLRLLNA